MITEKSCCTCGEVKPLDQFYRNRTMPHGRRYDCIECNKKKQKGYRATSPRRLVEGFDPLREGTKICYRCKQEKEIVAFHKDRSHKDGRSPECKECKNNRNNLYSKTHKRPHRALPIEKKRRKNALRQVRILKRAGILIEDTSQVLTETSDVCAICGKPETSKNQWGVKGLALDHDHKTGRFRGLLCFSCNVGLGKFQDDPDLLRRALEYLQSSAAVESVG